MLYLETDRLILRDFREAEHLDHEWHDGEMKTRLEYRLLKREWMNRK